MPRYRLLKISQRKNWHIQWTERNENNRTFTKRKSTNTEDREEAEVVLRDFEAKQENSKIKATVASIVDAYVVARKNDVLHPVSMENRAAHLKRILKRTLVRHIDRKRCDFYIRKRLNEGVGDGTIRTELSTLSSAFKYGEREGWIENAPYVHRPPKPEPRERWLRPDEWRGLLDQCKAFHLRLFVILAINTSARSGAILDLTWDRVNLELKQIDFRKPGDSMRRKRRTIVPINEPLESALLVALERAESDFVIEWNGGKVQSIKKAFKRAAVAANLSDVSAHTLRHTAASWMVQGGVSIDRVAAMLGHSDSRITQQVYAKHSPEYLKDAADALNSMQGSLVQL